MLVEVIDILGQHLLQMTLVDDEHPIQPLATHTAHPERSAIAFARGTRTGLRRTSMPTDANTALHSIIGFHHEVPGPLHYGIQGAYGAKFTDEPQWVYRGSCEPQTWTELLRGNGFGHIHARVEPAPDPRKLGTLIVEADLSPARMRSADA
ncbi:hypothetical protein [Amycolatopsis lurida]|uniref:hypothetical protein n=1 Tax=Amycolatopsis lurida TaxID=31959 RepID=UPI0036618E5D